MLDARRTWLRRLGTLGGSTVLVFAVYRAVTPDPNHCLHSTPQRGYACDPGSPTHHHFVLWLMVAVAGLAILVASRQLLGDEQ